MTDRIGGERDDAPDRPRQRKVVGPDRLLRLLNQRLESYGHCHNCKFVGPIRPLAEAGEDGRNWSRFVALVCTDGVASGCKRIAERILDDASAEYNLRLP
jgi:hypothetical protein